MDASPSTLVAWCSFCAVIIGAIVAVLRPDNKALPFSVPTGARVMLALVLGAVQTALMAVVSGTPWMQAVGTAVVSVIAALAAHGAPHAAAAVLCLVLATTSAGCATLSHWWGGGGEEQVLTLAEKIGKEALEGKSLAEIAIDLGIGVAQVIESILQDPKLLGTAAQHEAVSLRAGLVGVGCK